MNAHVKWVPDNSNEFVWQCCASPPFIMIRDSEGHVYPACIEDLNLIAEDKTFERVKPEGWTVISESSLEQRATTALNKIAAEQVHVNSDISKTIAQNMQRLYSR